MANTTPCRIVQVPGPQGLPGTSPAAPTDGINAYSLIDGGTVAIPAFGAAATIKLKLPSGSKWMSLVQYVYVQTIGFYQVVAVPDEEHATIINLGYPGNLDATGNFFDSALVSPAGPQGPAGVAPGGALLVANNLSDVNNATTSRTNLGLGSAALLAAAAVCQTANNLSDVTAATARTNLGLEIGTNVQAFSAFLAALVAVAPGAADQLAYLSGANTFSIATLTTYGRSLLSAADAAAGRVLLGVKPRYGLLGSLSGALFDAVTDQAITISSTRYRITDIVVRGASISLTTAAGGVYNAIAKPGGGVLVDAAQVYSALTASTKFLALTLGGVALTDVQTAGFIYLSLSTPQGAPATADVYVFGEDLS